MFSDFVDHMVSNKRRLAGLDPKDNPWVIKHNGRIVERASTQENAMQKLVGIQNHSIWEATRKDGYEIVNEPVSEKINTWDVFLNGKKIDTVTDQSDDPSDVKRSLVDHDGYDPGIVVKKRTGSYSESVNGSKLIEDATGEANAFTDALEYILKGRSRVSTISHLAKNFGLTADRAREIYFRAKQKLNKEMADHGLASPVESKTVTGVLKMLKSLNEKEIENFWVVVEPHSKSTLDDIVYSCDAYEFALQVKGGLDPDNIHGFYDNESEARSIANGLMKEMGEGKVPDDADPEDKKIEKLTEDTKSRVIELLKDYSTIELKELWVEFVDDTPSNPDYMRSTLVKRVNQDPEFLKKLAVAMGINESKKLTEDYEYEVVYSTEEGDKVVDTFKSEYDDLGPEDDRLPISLGSNEYIRLKESRKLTEPEPISDDVIKKNVGVIATKLKKSMKSGESISVDVIEDAISMEIKYDELRGQGRAIKAMVTGIKQELERAGVKVTESRKLTEQDTSPEKDKRPDDDPAKSDDGPDVERPDDPANPTPAEGEEQQKDTITKEYIGKSEDTHYYMVGTPSNTPTDEEDAETPDDLQIVDQEGKKVWSSTEQEIDPSDPADFIIQAIQELEIDEITRSVLVKYILPKLTEEDEEEAPEEMGEEAPAEEIGKPDEELPTGEEEKPFESKKVNEDQYVATGAEGEKYWREQLIKHLERMGDQLEPEEKELLAKAKKEADLDKFTPGGVPKDASVVGEGKVPDDADPEDKKIEKLTEDTNRVPDALKKFSGKALHDLYQKYIVGQTDEEMRDSLYDAMVDMPDEGPYGRNQFLKDIGIEESVTTVNKLIETKVQMGDDTFTVYQVDDGTDDVVIDINGTEYRFEKDFADMWRDEATGELTADGLQELALDALSNMEEEEYAELVAAGDQRSEGEIEAEADRAARDKKIDMEYDAREEERLARRFGEAKVNENDSIVRHLYNPNTGKTMCGLPAEDARGEGGEPIAETWASMNCHKCTSSEDWINLPEDEKHATMSESKVDEKTACTKKEKRQVKHIEKAEKKAGKTAKRAKEIAHATVIKRKNENKVNEVNEMDNWSQRLSDFGTDLDSVKNFIRNRGAFIMDYENYSTEKGTKPSWDGFVEWVGEKGGWPVNKWVNYLDDALVHFNDSLPVGDAFVSLAEFLIKSMNLPVAYEMADEGSDGEVEESRKLPAALKKHMFKKDKKPGKKDVKAEESKKIQGPTGTRGMDLLKNLLGFGQ